MRLFHREGFLQHLVQGNLLVALVAAENQAQFTGCVKIHEASRSSDNPSCENY